MKTNFKKILSVILCCMILSGSFIFSDVKARAEGDFDITIERPSNFLKLCPGDEDDYLMSVWIPKAYRNRDYDIIVSSNDEEVATASCRFDERDSYDDGYADYYDLVINAVSPGRTFIQCELMNDNGDVVDVAFFSDIFVSDEWYDLQLYSEDELQVKINLMFEDSLSIELKPYGENQTLPFGFWFDSDDEDVATASYSSRYGTVKIKAYETGYASILTGIYNPNSGAWYDVIEIMVEVIESPVKIDFYSNSYDYYKGYYFDFGFKVGDEAGVLAYIELADGYEYLMYNIEAESQDKNVIKVVEVEEDTDGNISILLECLGEGYCWIDIEARDEDDAQCGEFSFCVYVHKDEPECNHSSTYTYKQNEVAPTCTTAGKYEKVTKCSDCSEVINVQTVTVGAFGHSWSQYYYDHNASVYSDGTETSTCSRCGSKRSRTASGTKLLQNVQIYTGPSKTVGYRTKLTVTATADGIDGGYYLAIFEGDTLRKIGDSNTVSYFAGSVTSDKVFTVKVVDQSGRPVNNDLQKDIVVSVRTDFFSKFVSFLRSLFGLVPSVEIKP